MLILNFIISLILICSDFLLFKRRYESYGCFCWVWVLQEFFNWFNLELFSFYLHYSLWGGRRKWFCVFCFIDSLLICVSCLLSSCQACIIIGSMHDLYNCVLIFPHFLLSQMCEYFRAKHCSTFSKVSGIDIFKIIWPGYSGVFLFSLS